MLLYYRPHALQYHPNQRHLGWFWHSWRLQWLQSLPLVSNTVGNCLIVIVNPFSSQHNIKKKGQPELSEPSLVWPVLLVLHQSEIGYLSARTNPHHCRAVPGPALAQSLISESCATEFTGGLEKL